MLTQEELDAIRLIVREELIAAGVHAMYALAVAKQFIPPVLPLPPLDPRHVPTTTVPDQSASPVNPQS